MVLALFIYFFIKLKGKGIIIEIIVPWYKKDSARNTVLRLGCDLHLPQHGNHEFAFNFYASKTNFLIENHINSFVKFCLLVKNVILRPRIFVVPMVESERRFSSTKHSKQSNECFKAKSY